MNGPREPKVQGRLAPWALLGPLSADEQDRWDATIKEAKRVLKRRRLTERQVAALERRFLSVTMGLRSPSKPVRMKRLEADQRRVLREMVERVRSRLEEGRDLTSGELPTFARAALGELASLERAIGMSADARGSSPSAWLALEASQLLELRNTMALSSARGACDIIAAMSGEDSDKIRGALKRDTLEAQPGTSMPLEAPER